ncbi:MAG: cytochrome c [Myxococcales bacterium]|nr:cytochrome c [Myxococcales bacterium]
MRRALWLWAALLGCSRAPRSAHGPAIFEARCASCHGADGRGDGLLGRTSVPPARNFHDPAWQASRTDAQLEDVIRRGGLAVGKSPLMPASPDLVPSQMAELVRFIRAAGRTP